MDKIIIEGGKRLSGTIPISGAKNSALTLLPAILALTTIARRWLGGRSGVEMDHMPSRRNRLWNFAQGMRAGFALRIDPGTGRFVPFQEARKI